MQIAAKKDNALLTSMTNPLIRKLSKVSETSEAHVTLQGITNKSFFFLVSIAVGIALAYILNRIAPIAVDIEGTVQSISPVAIIALIVSGLFFILTPLLAFLIRATIPVTGTLYCLSTGYLFTFTGMIVPEYKGMIYLALVLTVAVVSALAILYGKRIVRVDAKLRTIVYTTLIAMAVGSLLTLIAYFIPGLGSIARFVTTNPLLSIAGSIVYVLIAALLLLVDFDAIERAIANEIPVKYEWLSAFSVVFSVIWLFLKILSLISKVKGSSSSKS